MQSDGDTPRVAGAREGDAQHSTLTNQAPDLALKTPAVLADLSRTEAERFQEEEKEVIAMPVLRGQYGWDQGCTNREI